MGKNHRRGYSSYNKHKQASNNKYKLRSMFVDKSFHDDLLKEIVNTSETNSQILTLMKTQFGYTQTDLIEIGEVLLWPGGESPTLTTILT